MVMEIRIVPPSWLEVGDDIDWAKVWEPSGVLKTFYSLPWGGGYMDLRCDSKPPRRPPMLLSPGVLTLA